MPKPIGWDTARDNLEAGYARIQHRRDEDLPDVPDLDPTPDLDMDPSQLRRAADVFREHGRVQAREQVANLAEKLTDRLPDLPPAAEPSLQWMLDWRPDRSQQ